MKKMGRVGARHWHSNRMPAELAALPDIEIGFIEPMQAKLVSDLPKGDVWQYEIKLDGYRALVLKAGGRVKLLSRNNHELNSRFPSIANSFEGLEDNTILDGEIVALDEWGRPSFNRLQNDRPPIFFYAFDLLAFRGKSLLGLPFRERRDLLPRLTLSGLGDPVRLSPTLDPTPAALIAAANKQGL